MKYYDKITKVVANLFLNPTVLYVFLLTCIIIKDLRNYYERVYS